MADPKPAGTLELAGVKLPANVMMPNSSSTLYRGERLSFSDGRGNEIDGVVMRISVVLGQPIVVELGDPKDAGQKPGKIILFDSGMVGQVVG